MDSIPQGEKQQKLQEFIDLIDPESLGAWTHVDLLDMEMASVVFELGGFQLMEMLVVYVECIDCVQDGRKKGRNNLWLFGRV